MTSDDKPYISHGINVTDCTPAADLGEFDEKKIQAYYSTLDLNDAGDMDSAIWCAQYQHSQDAAALAQMKSELDKAHESLAGNVCGYCWDKMHEGEIDKLRAELAKRDEAIKVMREALKVAHERDLDFDLIHTANSMELLQVWRGKCFDALAKTATLIGDE